MNKAEKIEGFAQKINKWLDEINQPLTYENVRRWFDLKYGKLPSERTIKEIFKKIDGRKKKIFKNT
ncbi:MAG: hypothetical protein AB1397_03000 [bacterium]